MEHHIEQSVVWQPVPATENVSGKRACNRFGGPQVNRIKVWCHPDLVQQMLALMENRINRDVVVFDEAFVLDLSQKFVEEGSGGRRLVLTFTALNTQFMNGLTLFGRGKGLNSVPCRKRIILLAKSWTRKRHTSTIQRSRRPIWRNT